MNEVSRRAAFWPYDKARSVGLSEEETLRGTGLDLATLKRSRRIDWEAYVVMMDNLYEVVGTEGMCDMGREYAFKESFRSIHRIAGLVASPRALYHFLVRWAGPANNTNLRFAIEDEPGGTLYHTVTIEEGYRDCQPFLVGSPGLLEVVPCMLGLPKAKVELVELRERFGAYRIHLPESQAVGARLKRGLKAIFTVPSVLIEQTQELKDRSDALNRQQADFRGLVDDMVDCVFIVVADEVVYANKAAHALLEIPLDTDPRKIADVVSGLLSSVRQDDWRRLLQGRHTQDQRTELTLEGKHEQSPILSFGKPQAIRYGESEGWLLSGRNVTPERRLEARMREVAYRERHRLALELHDGLGQQLTGISWQASVLRDELQGPEQDAARQAAENLAQVARSCVDVARNLSHGLAASDTGRDNVRRALVQWKEQTVSLLGIRITLDLPKETLTAEPSHIVEITRIAAEATHNAVRHATAKKVRVRLVRKEGRWVFVISNDGTPITTKALSAKTGLGLESMAYRARALGGEFHIGPTERGTEMTISMEAKTISTESVIKTNEAADPKVRSSEDTETLRVFLADDHELVRVGLVQLLESQPAISIVGQAKERAQILPLVTHLKPDLAILDMLMDGQDNLAIIKDLCHVLPKCRIIVLSMGAAHIYAEEAHAAGAVDYLMKNITPQALIERILTVGLAATTMPSSKETLPN